MQLQIKYSLLRSILAQNQNVVEFIEKQILSKHSAQAQVIRWAIVAFSEHLQEFTVNYQVLDEVLEFSTCVSLNAASEPVRKVSEASLGAFVVPTGIGCSIGGFAGDATLAANLIADEFDYLLANPNVFNAGAWHNMPNNLLYVEGYFFDLFLQGKIGLRPKNNFSNFSERALRLKSNRIGVIFDKGIPEKLLQKEKHVLNSAKLIYGLDILPPAKTQEPLEINIEMANGLSSGMLKNPRYLIKAALELKEQGAEAIAIVTNLEEACRGLEQFEDQYSVGAGPDPIGGIEAVISHLVGIYVELPCAHAPVFEADSEFSEKISPKVSPEISSFSYLPCVLRGLSFAPQIVPVAEAEAGDLLCKNLQAFIGPANCWGGSSFLSALQNTQIRKYVVELNKSCLDIKPELFSLDFITCANYLELSGYLTAASLGYSVKALKNFY